MTIYRRWNNNRMWMQSTQGRKGTPCCIRLAGPAGVPREAGREKSRTFGIDHLFTYKLLRLNIYLNCSSFSLAIFWRQGSCPLGCLFSLIPVKLPEGCSAVVAAVSRGLLCDAALSWGASCLSQTHSEPPFPRLRAKNDFLTFEMSNTMNTEPNQNKQILVLFPTVLAVCLWLSKTSKLSSQKPNRVPRTFQEVKERVCSAQFGDDLPLEELVILFKYICDIFGFHIGAVRLTQHLH